MASQLTITYDVFKTISDFLQVSYVDTLDGYTVVCVTRDFIFRSDIVDQNDIDDFIADIYPYAISAINESDAVALSSYSPHLDSREHITCLQKKFDVAGATYKYIGYAAFGATASQYVWKIKRFTSDGNGDITEEKWSQPRVKWDDRTTISYS